MGTQIQYDIKTGASGNSQAVYEVNESKLSRWHAI